MMSPVVSLTICLLAFVGLLFDSGVPNILFSVSNLSSGSWMNNLRPRIRVWFFILFSKNSYAYELSENSNVVYQLRLFPFMIRKVVAAVAVLYICWCSCSSFWCYKPCRLSRYLFLACLIFASRIISWWPIWGIEDVIITVQKIS